LILLSEPDGDLTRSGKHVETGMALILGYQVYVIAKRKCVSLASFGKGV
jgi:hypothetical protein